MHVQPNARKGNVKHLLQNLKQKSVARMVLLAAITLSAAVATDALAAGHGGGGGGFGGGHVGGGFDGGHVHGGQIQLPVRAPAGTRIETTEKIFQEVEDKIREIIPESERALIVDNIGSPARAYNLAFTDGSTIGVNDGTILVSLKDGHAPTAEYVRKLREALAAAFPEDVFYFQAADIVTQILNFGLPAQIDVRTVGYDRTTNLRVAKEMQRRIAAIPGIADAHLQQEVDAPAFYATIDRARAEQLGLNANTIATNLNVSLSSSEQVSPNFWTDPSSGIPYFIAVQTPEPKVASLNDLSNTPVSGTISPAGAVIPGLLSNVATIARSTVPTNTNQTNVQRLRSARLRLANFPSARGRSSRATDRKGLPLNGLVLVSRRGPGSFFYGDRSIIGPVLPFEHGSAGSQCHHSALAWCARGAGSLAPTPDQIGTSTTRRDQRHCGQACDGHMGLARQRWSPCLPAPRVIACFAGGPGCHATLGRGLV